MSLAPAVVLRVFFGQGEQLHLGSLQKRGVGGAQLQLAGKAGRASKQQSSRAQMAQAHASLAFSTWAKARPRFPGTGAPRGQRSRRGSRQWGRVFLLSRQAQCQANASTLALALADWLSADCPGGFRSCGQLLVLHALDDHQGIGLDSEMVTAAEHLRAAASSVIPSWCRLACLSSSPVLPRSCERHTAGRTEGCRVQQWQY